MSPATFDVEGGSRRDSGVGGTVGGISLSGRLGSELLFAARLFKGGLAGEFTERFLGGEGGGLEFPGGTEAFSLPVIFTRTIAAAPFILSVCLDLIQELSDQLLLLWLKHA